MLVPNKGWINSDGGLLLGIRKGADERTLFLWELHTLLDNQPQE